MAKKTTKRITPPVRLQNQIKLIHQSYFLNYINELATEVSAELKKLTPKSETLFGKFPLPSNTVTESKSVFVWIFEPFYEVQKELWRKIDTVFWQCIWKESRERFGHSTWFSILRENDNELKEIHEYEDELKKVSFQHVESLPKEKLNALRDIFASNYTKPKKSLTISDLQHSYWEAKMVWLRGNDEIYAKFWNIKCSKLLPLIEFQNKFDSLLKKFNLEKDWLARSVFRAIWNDTGKLQIEGFFSEDIPEQVNIEIENSLGIANNEFRETDITLPNPFIYQEPYMIHESFKEYEQKAVEAYRQHLHHYFKAIKDALIKYGYKEPRGDKYEYEKLQRLVYWNNSDFDELWEVIQHIPEFEEVDVNNPNQRKKAVDKLRKSFIEFEKYDLPIRPFGESRN